MSEKQRPRPDRNALDVIWAPLSLVAWTGSFAFMFVAFAGSVVGCLFLPFERFQRYWAAPVIAQCLRLTGSRVRVRHHPALDRQRASVFVQNHVSMMDAHIAAYSIPTAFCGLENEAHLKLPIYGWLLSMGNAIPVPAERGEGRFVKIAAAFRERASRGVSVLAFPEGHRTLDGKVRPFRRGVFFAARDAGIPVVPFATRGMWNMLPKGTWLCRPSRLESLVGPQVETAGLTDEQVEDLSATFHRILAAWSERGEDVVDAEIEAFRERVARNPSAASG